MKKFRLMLMMAAFVVSIGAAFAFKAQEEWYIIEDGQVQLYNGQPGDCLPSSVNCFYTLKSGAAPGSDDPNDYEGVPSHANEVFVRP